MVGSKTIHCARADTVMPNVTSASAMNFFMVCLSLCCRCRRQHAANHEKGFTTKRRRRGVSRAQDSMKSVERNANGHVTVQDTSTVLLRQGCVRGEAAAVTVRGNHQPRKGLAIARRKPHQTRQAQQWGFPRNRISAVLPATKNYFKIAIDNFDPVVHIHIKMSKELDMAKVEN